MSKSKLVALLFALFITWVIFAADTGTFPPAIRYLYDLPGYDKIGHFVLYGILALLLALAFPRRGRLRLTKAALLLAALVALEEFSQSFFPNRTASWVDLTFSFLGILAGDWLAGRFRKKS